MRKQEELEERIRVAIDHAAPNVLDRILSSCEEQKGNVIPMTTGKKNWKKQIVSFVSAAAAVCILFTAALEPGRPGGGFDCYAGCESQCFP